MAGGDEDNARRWNTTADGIPQYQQQRGEYMQEHDLPYDERLQYSNAPNYAHNLEQSIENVGGSSSSGRSARHPAQQQDQQQPEPSRSKQYSNYSRNQVEMQERGSYPPPVQYLNTAALASGSGSGNNHRVQPSQRTAANSGPAYSPAPLATASMADLSNSLTSSTDTTLAAKKQRRVYNTAFGPFSWADLLKRKYWKYYAGLAILSILVLLAVIFHDDIIKWMQPWAEKIRDIKGGWAIWVGIMFVISFPPLFGQEVVCLLCGLIYGLWWGFAIISLGTMLGEWGNFIVFKYFCSARSEKMESRDVTYACMCRVVREGGFRIAFMARLSAIPGHLTTPVFAACGMSLWVFSITAIITLPKQLMAVYLGTVFGKADDNTGITTSKIVEWVVLGVSFLITILAAWYIYSHMGRWRSIVMEEQLAKRQAAEGVLVGNERPNVEGTVGAYSKERVVPKVTLSDESGIVQSPSRHSNRVSMNRWPFHKHGNNRGSDSRSGDHPSNLEEGSMGDMDGANRPLVLDSVDPAGHYSASTRRQQQQRQDGHLYPAQEGHSPYTSSEEDIGYGYADGGEAYNSPTPYDLAASSNVSLKWQPPQMEQTPMSALNQQQHPQYHNNNAKEQQQHRQLSPQPSQYDPSQYRQQTHYTTQARSAPGLGLPTAANEPSQASSLPASLPQDEHAGRDALDRQQISGGYELSEQRTNSKDSQATAGARLYPQSDDLMPQPQGGQYQEVATQHTHVPASRYPEMREPTRQRRPSRPVSSVNYHTNPVYPSAYHTGPAHGDNAYRTNIRPQHDPQEGQYPPVDAPHRYQS